MAAQLLPIFLLGGGAAYVYSKQKAKARKRSGADCPPENTVTIGEMATVSAQSEEKFKNEPDPFVEANYAIKHLLSEYCNRNSKNSRIKVQIADKEALDISIPDFYMMILSDRTGVRVDRGMITKDQADAIQAHAFDWYKKTTGKTFDPSNLGLEKFAMAFAMAMKEAIEKGLKEGKMTPLPGPTPGPMGECPSRVIIDLSDNQRNQIVTQMKQMVANGERSPFAMAEVFFQATMPEACAPKNFKTVVEARHNGELFKTYNAASYFAAIVLDSMEELITQGLMTESTANQVFNDLKAAYKGLTGEELPSNLN